MTDHEAMQLALTEARRAAEMGEVPVGAVVIKDGVLVATGRNATIGTQDPTAHAEIVALRAAAQVLGNYRLDGCELFVTLEPCAMCSGAMLHARLKRLVFAAADPKTGVAGSVLNLFAHPQLNHQTEVEGGIMAETCGAMLQEFFLQRRQAQRQEQVPLREDALRTPEARFTTLPGYPWTPRYLGYLPSLNGLRMHYLDEGTSDADTVFVCLHGTRTWSHQFRTMLPVWLAAGCRVLAPDMPGCGRSDKPKKESAHSFEWHRKALFEWVEQLDLQQMVLVLDHGNEGLGMALLMAAPQRYKGLLRLPGSGERAESAADAAPYPDKGHRAASRAFASAAWQQSQQQAMQCFEAQTTWRGPVLQASQPADAGVAEQALLYFQK